MTAINGNCVTCGNSLDEAPLIKSGAHGMYNVMVLDDRGKHHFSCWQRPPQTEAALALLERVKYVAQLETLVVELVEAYAAATDQHLPERAILIDKVRKVLRS